jgi:hypothetical protein
MTTNGTSKQVRTQAMRDYLRKQTKEAITGVPEIVAPPVTLDKPSQYKGRFKLNTWTHKGNAKSLNGRKAGSRIIAGMEANQGIVAQRGNKQVDDREWQAMNAGGLSISVFSANGRLDPFNSLPILLGPHSENLLVHCELPHGTLYLSLLFPSAVLLAISSTSCPFLIFIGQC